MESSIDCNDYHLYIVAMIPSAMDADGSLSPAFIKRIDIRKYLAS
jgi:hypothetical protein